MDELREDIKELKAMFVKHSVRQDEIYDALVGKPQFKIKGIVEEVSDLKLDKEKRAKRNAMILGASIAGSLGIQKLISYLGTLFG